MDGNIRERHPLAAASIAASRAGGWGMNMPHIISSVVIGAFAIYSYINGGSLIPSTDATRWVILGGFMTALSVFNVREIFKNDR